MLNGKISGPVFDAVERVIGSRSEYASFRRGELSPAAYAALLDDCAAELAAEAVPGEDVHFAKRFPWSAAGCVRGVLEQLVQHRILPVSRYDEAACDALERETRRSFEHGGYHTYIYPEEARLLFAVADILKPRRAVFLGSYYGYWAHWAIPPIVRGGGRVVLVDPDDAANERARRNLAGSPYQGAVAVVTSRGEAYLDQTAEIFDLVVLDAEGPRTHPETEQRGKRVYHPLMRHCLPRLAPSAVLVCHNILFSDASGDPFFGGVIARNEDELALFRRLVAREFAPFLECPTTEGVGIGIRRHPAGCAVSAEKEGVQ